MVLLQQDQQDGHVEWFFSQKCLPALPHLSLDHAEAVLTHSQISLGKLSDLVFLECRKGHKPGYLERNTSAWLEVQQKNTALARDSWSLTWQPVLHLCGTPVKWAFLDHLCLVFAAKLYNSKYHRRSLDYEHGHLCIPLFCSNVLSISKWRKKERKRNRMFKGRYSCTCILYFPK